MHVSEQKKTRHLFQAGRAAVMAHPESCECGGERHSPSILYSLLKKESAPCASARAPRGARFATCACGVARPVALRSPHATCSAASAVLAKTLRFVKSVPCFGELPACDQRALVRSGWAPLLVLGMAQDGLDFETRESAEPSMLQRLLTGAHERTASPRDHTAHVNNGGGGGGGGGGVALVEAQGIKAFLSKCWDLDISTKEYAYLKGAILFNPDIAGLQCQHYIQALQSEAHQALNEHVKLIHRGDTTRFDKLFIALSMLRSINANVVAGLFFRPVIGTVNMEELLLEMFYGK
ncbi:nuclear receptor subfamily 0 group B member 1 [Clarias gariepinus]|uniref:nuclear receptor subfamily 0 group B member 1 n=1 Tax=Clarias gariepinus TaxID=13013 RepID=UPI00234CE5E1|nr:nuclear receptor subfamily 0 group B member 1 [Clarias gariepinus]